MDQELDSGEHQKMSLGTGLFIYLLKIPTNVWTKFGNKWLYLEKSTTNPAINLMSLC